MKNFIQPGDVVSMTAPTGGVVAGRGVLIGQLFGVATSTVAQTLPFEMATQGVFELAKTSALQIDIGDVVYWDDTAKVVNKTSAAQKEVGYAVSAAANPSATVKVLLCPTPRTSVAA
jgi:predicted RecA/RadA family phage recombinase